MDGLREGALIELMAALNSSLNLREVLSTTYGLLSRLLVADYAAICVSKPEKPTEYDWVEQRMPEAFFARYAELADADFVRRAVVRSPNTVLRDSEMLSRAELKRSPFYRYCRELQMPLEYVMAVLLDMRLDWHGGFTLYRESPRRPFSGRERRFLQRLSPVLASTIRNCRMVSEMQQRGQLLETLFHHGGTEKIVLIPGGPELLRTDRFNALLRRWFAPLELNSKGLPSVLAAKVSQLAAMERPFTFGEDLWERPEADRNLRVTFVPLPEQGGRRPWALLMEEVPHLKPIPVPRAWQRKLTPRELQVVELMMRGVDNQFIANELGISVNTVKTHLKSLYVKLAVPSRAKLILAAQEQNAWEEGRGGPPGATTG
jgi:DNA-binding CsgD family transcriptional regulator